MKKQIFAFIVGTAAIVGSCSSGSSESPKPAKKCAKKSPSTNSGSTLNLESDESLLLAPAVSYTYDQHVKSILSNRCGACHNASKRQNPVFDTYETTKSNYVRIAARILAQTMPPKPNSPVTSSEGIILASWAQSGFLQNASSSPSTDPSTTTTTTTSSGSNAVSYTTHIKPLLTTSCVSCHGGTQKTSPDLTTYAGAKAAANAALSAVQRTSAPMPKGQAAWSADKISLLKSWISGGMLENATNAGSTTPESSSDAKTGC